MNYSNYQISEIRNLEDKSLLFETVQWIDSKGDKAYWKDIFEASSLFFSCNGNSQLMKKYPSEEDLKLLVRDYNFDINYIDRGGNNLLMYVLATRNRPSSSEYPIFDSWMDYLITETDDLFLSNRGNENLLFSFTSIHTCGVNGKHFFKFLEKVYNTKLDLNNTTVSVKEGFDFNQKTTLGRNVLFYCLMNGAPKEVMEFHLDHGVKIDVVDEDGYNLLYFMDKYSLKGVYGDFAEKLFSKTFESLENPFSKNKYGESFIEQLMSFVKDEKVHRENKERYIEWLKLSFKKISQNEFSINEKTMESLGEFFDLEPSHEIQNEFKKAKTTFHANLLNTTLSQDSNKKKKKAKI